MAAIRRLTLALAPLALTPVLGFALAEGFLNLGGGEKDLIWILPWALWAIVFAIANMILWYARWPIARTGVAGAVAATLVVVVTAAVLTAR